MLLFTFGLWREIRTIFSVFFSGENELFSISNGVIVITDKNEIFYGGNLEEKQGKLSDIVAYTTSFYILSDDKDRILLSNSVEDMTGGTISIANEMGKDEIKSKLSVSWLK